MTLFRTHADGLAGAVRGVIGEPFEIGEVLQEAFVRALRAVRRGARPRDEVAWVFVIAMNTAKEHRRHTQRRARRVTDLGAEMLNVASTHPDPDAFVEREETLETLKQAIHRLPSREKEVFILRVSAGLTFTSIGSALEIPEGTAKTRMRSALKNLRQYLLPFAPESVHGENAS